MIRLLRQIFPGKERKEALDALNRMARHFDDQSSWDLVYSKVRYGLISYPSDQMRIFANGPQSANCTVLATIARIAEVMAISGEFHTYRGRLSLTGMGLNLIAVRAISILKDEGGITTARADDWMQEIEDGILAAG